MLHPLNGECFEVSVENNAFHFSERALHAGTTHNKRLK